MAASSPLVSKTLEDISSTSRSFNEVYVMFSGGQDSLVVLHLTSRAIGKVRALFIDTGIATPGLLEYVVDTCKDMGVELEVVKPSHDYFELVLSKGFPTITRRWCKEFLKERPLIKWLDSKDKEGILLITGVRADESWMKRRAVKFFKHPKLKVATYAPIIHWSKGDVVEYVRREGLRRCPLYEVYGKAYDCWCSVYKSPADFALLAINHPEFFARFCDVESKLKGGGAGLFYGGQKVYFKDIKERPYEYLRRYPRTYECPMCSLLQCSACMTLELKES